MLAYFSFRNHGPFKSECMFDMRAVDAYKEHQSSVAHPLADASILKIATVYGANAAGKSQFVDAYCCFQRMVTQSFGGVRDAIEKSYAPFLFSSDSCEAETEYEAKYIDELGTYRYGFSHNGERVLEEWLYYVNAETRRMSVILERDQSGLHLGTSVRGECRKYATDIADDTLALSFFRRLALKTKIFNRVAQCVVDICTITSRMCTADISYTLRRYFERDFNNEEKKALLDLLSAIDSGITDITVERSNSGVQVLTHHKGLDGRDYQAPIEIESSGTRKVIALYSFFSKAVKTGRGLLIDELDAQLHPLVLKYLVDMFKRDNSFGQLIYTSHDISLLDKRYIRRDQVWVVEKEAGGSSTMYSIAEFKPRKDLRLGTAYLSGVFGGIPKILESDVVEGF